MLFAAPSRGRGRRPDQLLVGRPRRDCRRASAGSGKDAVYTVTSRSTPADRRRPARRRREHGPRARSPTSTRRRPIATERVRRSPTRITAGRADDLRQGPRDRSAGSRATRSTPSTRRSRRAASTSSTTSCSSRASVGASRSRAASSCSPAASASRPGSPPASCRASVTALSGRFVVRERDAHAWTEIYFPGVGWQGFDPTASVPLAGEARLERLVVRDRPRSHGGTRRRCSASCVGAVVAAPDLLAGIRRRLGPAALVGVRARSPGSNASARRAGRPREPAETPREYARGARDTCGDRPELAAVGDVIDRDAFSSGPADAQARAAAEAAAERPSLRRGARCRAAAEMPCGRGGAMRPRSRAATVAATVKGIPRGPYGGAT